MAPLTVVAKIVAKKESLSRVKSELLQLMAPTRNEQGCIAYRLHQDIEDPALFTFYETWESPACLDAHMNSVHFKQFVSAVDGLLAELVVHKMNEIQ